jgi:hypothetical protein
VGDQEFDCQSVLFSGVIFPLSSSNVRGFDFVSFLEQKVAGQIAFGCESRPTRSLHM